MKLIYVLELENNKYYVGKTHNVEKRFNEHLNGNGSEFTKIYKPMKIYKVYKVLSEFDEDNYTKKYMKIYGIDNVRGGSYCTKDLNKHQINLLNKELIKELDSIHFIKLFIKKIPDIILNNKLVDLYNYIYNENYVQVHRAQEDVELIIKILKKLNIKSLDLLNMIKIK